MWRISFSVPSRWHLSKNKTNQSMRWLIWQSLAIAILVLLLIIELYMKISYAYRIKLLLNSHKINFHKKSTTLISLIITKTLYNKNSSVKRYTYSQSHNTFNYTKWQKKKQYTKCIVKKVLIKKKKPNYIYLTHLCIN